jgi:hypothetical protein
LVPGLAVLAIALAGCGSRSSKNPSGLYIVTQDGRAGYIDHQGKFVWNPTR